LEVEQLEEEEEDELPEDFVDEVSCCRDILFLVALRVGEMKLLDCDLVSSVCFNRLRSISLGC
jgi:hypothetical protein